jgi:hypothetical protein
MPGKSSVWTVYYKTLKSAGFETVVPFVSAVEFDNPAAHQALSPLLQRQGLTGDAAWARLLERGLFEVRAKDTRARLQSILTIRVA